MTDHTRLHVVVRGRVQGVGFRYFVQQAAHPRALSGWVRNREDGAVEVEVEGDVDAVRELHVALRTGPRGAVVEAVEELPVGAQRLDHPFRILR